jgi:DNA topoisomerase-3
MTGISRYVTDSEIKKILKETDGLGTEATRAGIIELLFKRGYLIRQGKSILATPVGTGLIRSLPESATTPDMTALWENSLDAISQKRLKYDAFMQPLLTQLDVLITQASSQLPSALQGVASPNKGAKKPFKKKAAASTRSRAKSTTTSRAKAQTKR